MKVCLMVRFKNIYSASELHFIVYNYNICMCKDINLVLVQGG